MLVITLIDEIHSGFAVSKVAVMGKRRALPRVRALLMATVSILTLLLTHSMAYAADASREYQLKATFLYNVCKFVEWPAERFADVNTPLVIGILGADPFGDELVNVVKDKKINGHNVVIKQVATAEAAKMTHVLFISAGEAERFAALRSELTGNAILTVGESRTFLEGGGIFRFSPVGDKLSFEINMSAADKAHLKISAQLQKLATDVRRSL